MIFQKNKNNDGLLSDWLTHQHRDTCASIVGHPPLATYLSIADGEATGRVRFEMIEVSYHASKFSVISLSFFYQLAHAATVRTSTP
jgi:hypothetical protein